MAKEKQVPTYKPSDEEKEELSFIYERWEKMKEGRAVEEKEWDLDEEQFLMNAPRPADLDGWKADLQLPDTASAVLASASEMVDNAPGVTYFPRESSDQQKADKYNAGFKYSWEKGQGNVHLLDHMIGSSIYGTGIGKEVYRYETCEYKDVSEWKKDEDGNDTPIPEKWEKRTRVKYEDCIYLSLPIRNVWFTEGATSLDDAHDSVEVENPMDPDTFHERFDAFYPNAKYVGAGEIDTSIFNWFKPILHFSDKIVVAHYYNIRRDMYAIFANGVLLTLVGNPNPYRHKELPYVRSVYLPRPNSFYGWGIPRIIRHLQAEKNTVRNMRLDREKLAINPMMVVDDKIELDEDDLMSRPFQVIKGSPDSVEFKNPPPVNPSAYKEEEMIRNDMIVAHGIDPRLQSLGGGGDTATEIAILKETSLKRIRLSLRLLEWQALYRIARLRLSNMLQFYSVPKFEKILSPSGEIIDSEPRYPTVRVNAGQGPQYLTFEESDFKGEYDVVVATDSTLPVSEALEAQKSINLFDRLKGHPDVNQRKLVENLLRKQRENPGDYMTTQGEPPMGQSPARPEGMGIEPMPGNGMGNQGMGPEMGNPLPTLQQNGVNTNQ